MTSHVLYEVARSPALDKYLTHYYVFTQEDGDFVPIGEAGDVQEIGPDQWHALVGTWGINPVTHRTDPRLTKRVQGMTVRGPRFLLVPKEDFEGLIPE